MRGGKKENQRPLMIYKIVSIFAFGGKWVLETLVIIFLVDGQFGLFIVF